MRTAVLIVLAVVAVSLAAAGPAQADDQIVTVNLTLNGFNNNKIIAGFTSTDVFDPITSCNAGSSSGCSANHSYGSPPKNIANFLCIPNGVTYAISQSCQSLLSLGVSTGCHSNSLSTYCDATYSSPQVSPACNWRTNDNKSPVNWNWSLTLQNGGVVAVDCSLSNYQGPEQ